MKQPSRKRIEAYREKQTALGLLNNLKAIENTKVEIGPDVTDPNSPFHYLLPTVQQDKDLFEAAVRHSISPILIGQVSRVQRLLKEAPPISKDAVLESLRQGNTQTFFDALPLDPDLLDNPEVRDLTIKTWFRQKLSRDKKARVQAQRNLREIGKQLALFVSGRVSELTEGEEQNIAAEYKGWLRIFQNVKNVWDNPEWSKVSPEGRENIREKLARRLSIPGEMVNTAERYLKASSQSGIASPSEATKEMIADKYTLGSAATVEKIWEKWRRKFGWPKQNPTPDH